MLLLLDENHRNVSALTGCEASLQLEQESKVARRLVSNGA